jgi:hypothetical protein
MSAERIPFEMQIECSTRRDRGKKSLEIRVDVELVQKDRR